MAVKTKNPPPEFARQDTWSTEYNLLKGGGMGVCISAVAVPPMSKNSVDRYYLNTKWTS